MLPRTALPFMLISGGQCRRRGPNRRHATRRQLAQVRRPLGSRLSGWRAPLQRVVHATALLALLVCAVPAYAASPSPSPTRRGNPASPGRPAGGPTACISRPRMGEVTGSSDAQPQLVLLNGSCSSAGAASRKVASYSWTVMSTSDEAVRARGRAGGGARRCCAYAELLHVCGDAAHVWSCQCRLRALWE
jgi:hypothetical protein